MKFTYLLKKELKELLNATTIITIVICVAACIGLGQIMNTAMEESMSESGEINICNKDSGAFSKAVIESLRTLEYEVTLVDIDDQSDYAPQLDKLDIDDVIIIPKTFSQQITDVLANKKNEDGAIPPVDVEYISRMSSLAMSSSIDADTAVALAAIEAAVKSVVYANKNVSIEEIALMEAPVNLIETTVVGNKQAEASATLLSAYVMMSGMFVPIVIFVLIMYSSQMIMNAISTEKIDKTLETLLSAPISRLSVLSAKMTAATIVSAVYAIAFMFGFSYMMDGMTGTVSDAVDANIISELGLQLSTSGYILLALQMFMSLLITLALSLILGALAKDAKSSQTLMLPIMGMAMVPYMLSMFIDFKSMGAARWLMYAIPYTHTFMAQSNIILGDTGIYLGGLIYQIILLIICMTCAVRLFTSDKIFTISLNFGQKKNKYAKKKKT